MSYPIPREGILQGHVGSLSGQTGYSERPFADGVTRGRRAFNGLRRLTQRSYRRRISEQRPLLRIIAQEMNRCVSRNFVRLSVVFHGSSLDRLQTGIFRKRSQSRKLRSARTA